MKYLMLIYTEEGSEPGPGTPEFDALLKEYFDFSTEVKGKGISLSSNALQPVATATTVRVREGKTMTVDGPFAETKEQLGGYYLMECKDLDEAIAYAARIPSARVGSIEVRPIQVFESPE